MIIDWLSTLVKPILPNDGISATAVVASSVAIIAFMQSRSKRRNPFPNATPFPFNQTAIGEFLYLYVMISRFHNGDSSSYFRSLRKKLGSVFFLGPIGSIPHKCPCILLSDPKDQADIIKLEKELKLYVNLPDTALAIEGKHNIQSIPVGPTHAALRKVYSSILSPRSLEAFTTIILQGFQSLWQDLEMKQNGELEIQTAIREKQLELMCKILYGFGSETDEDRQILSEFSNDFELTAKALFAIGGEKSKEFRDGLEAKKRINKILFDKFDSIFDKRMAQESEQNHIKTNAESVIGSAMDQIVDGLIRSGCTSKDEGEENGSISYNIARENLYLLLEASHMTTMTVTSSMMYFLNHSKNRKSLDRVRDEVRKLEPTYLSLKGFSFGGACVEETLRLAPIVGSVSYFVPKGKSFTVRGVVMNGPIVVNFQSSNWYQDEDVFEDANNFKPERWLPGEQQEVSRFARSTFRPFGFGRHICLGSTLARLVMNANLYCFASNPNRSILFDEKQVKVQGGLFPEKQVCNNFIGKVIRTN